MGVEQPRLYPGGGHTVTIERACAARAVPPLTDVLGWSAAALTLLAFSCNDLVRLRYMALSANAAFIAYGLTAQLWPVLALHFVLVPINAWRLRQTLHGQRETLAQRSAPASP